MDLFRVRIRLMGPIASPLASGMIFGQLCWALRDLDGERALIDWLASPGEIWGMSDAFPADHLPRPILPMAPSTNGRVAADDRKALKRRDLITRAGFLRLRNRLTDASLGDDELRVSADDSRRTARNSIDRHTGRALDQGGLYFREESWPRESNSADLDERRVAGFARDIYIDAPAAAEGKIRGLFAHMGEAGFGKSAGLGRGRYAVDHVARETELANAKGANLHLSLSRGTRTPNMASVHCRVEPHFGKAGSRVTIGEGVSAFKRPLILTRVGATFARAGAGRFGEWLTDVHPTRPEIGHNAFHVTLPFTSSEPVDA